MPEKDESVVTCAVPAALMEEAKEAESDLQTASREFLAATEQRKEAKTHLDECQSRFNSCCTNVLHPEKADGFPDGTPMADAKEGDGDEPQPAEPAELDDF